MRLSVLFVFNSLFLFNMVAWKDNAPKSQCMDGGIGQDPWFTHDALQSTPWVWARAQGCKRLLQERLLVAGCLPTISASSSNGVCHPRKRYILQPWTRKVIDWACLAISSIFNFLFEESCSFRGCFIYTNHMSGQAGNCSVVGKPIYHQGYIGSLPVKGQLLEGPDLHHPPQDDVWRQSGKGWWGENRWLKDYYLVF